ncbi:hypothetical protein [Aquimarina sp. 2201CG14-23]|uniref:hypothetical protein n=1 Tax=Aquimarina mycalae TaxID=3040073 RepID=UPI002477EC0E|nr:hypothetical protein [Aquimarina sp. 2201CG14-23]MDH7446827.1 hypothetical protein [Aquimarina sp. 2201CG14-23]
MTKQLHSAVLFISLLLATTAHSQQGETALSVSISGHDITVLNLFDTLENNLSLIEKDFSYEFSLDNEVHDHSDHHELVHDSHSHEISLIDFISSDSGSDFNCSGGFCMDKSHFHKRGLTLKKQLFDYFMKISC